MLGLTVSYITVVLVVFNEINFALRDLYNNSLKFRMDWETYKLQVGVGLQGLTSLYGEVVLLPYLAKTHSHGPLV